MENNSIIIILISHYLIAIVLYTYYKGNTIKLNLLGKSKSRNTELYDQYTKDLTSKVKRLRFLLYVTVIILVLSLIYILGSVTVGNFKLPMLAATPVQALLTYLTNKIISVVNYYEKLLNQTIIY